MSAGEVSSKRVTADHILDADVLPCYHRAIRCIASLVTHDVEGAFFSGELSLLNPGRQAILNECSRLVSYAFGVPWNTIRYDVIGTYSEMMLAHEHPTQYDTPETAAAKARAGRDVFDLWMGLVKELG